jgi:hypothetical protein
MIEIVWEFLVLDETRGQFELAFGPGGAWSKLFARQPGFRGTTLMRDTNDPHRYLMIDLWDTETQRKQALSEQSTAYENLLASFAGWTKSKTNIGCFRVLAEGTVRPYGRATRGKR